ncbi:MAG: peptidase [Synechococcus sp.]|nr:peptidase [Synechococcus sp.]
MSLHHCPPAQEIRSVDQSLRSSPSALLPGYASQLAYTPVGPPVLKHWCVWVQPPRDGLPDRWEQRWLDRVEAGLDAWSSLVSMTRVSDPERAHVRVERRRPPLRRFAQGWRASNGRTLLQTLEVRREGAWRLEPRLTVLISPGLRAPVLQATALHELGHAFGLWGHSDQASDAMAVHQGRQPVLRLSSRDRDTLRWLLEQPTQFGTERTPTP